MAATAGSLQKTTITGDDRIKQPDTIFRWIMRVLTINFTFAPSRSRSTNRIVGHVKIHVFSNSGRDHDH